MMNDARTRKTICVVDDDADVRDSIRAILESCGYVVRTYSSASALLGRRGAVDHDCLLLDLNMPEMNGVELLERLRAQGVATPAIFLTGNGNGLKARMKRAGALKVLYKPVSDEDLLFWIELACKSA